MLQNRMLEGTFVQVSDIAHVKIVSFEESRNFILFNDLTYSKFIYNNV